MKFWPGCRTLPFHQSWKSIDVWRSSGHCRSRTAGDCVLIAGKGHESEQIIGCERFPFDDRQITREILARTMADLWLNLLHERADMERLSVRDLALATGGRLTRHVDAGLDV